MGQRGNGGRWGLPLANFSLFSVGPTLPLRTFSYPEADGRRPRHGEIKASNQGQGQCKDSGNAVELEGREITEHHNPERNSRNDLGHGIGKKQPGDRQPESDHHKNRAQQQKKSGVTELGKGGTGHHVPYRARSL